MLFGARALQGGIAALMAPAALSILTITFQPDRASRPRPSGPTAPSSGAGGAIGVLAGGILTQYASWRWCLLVNVPIALAAAVAASGVMLQSRSSGTTSYDVPGCGLVDGRAGEPGLRVHQGGNRRMVGLGGPPFSSCPPCSSLEAFVIVESRSKHPLFPLRVVAERNRAGAFLASLLTGAGLFAMFVFLSYYIQEVLRFSAMRAGVAFLPFAAGLIIAADSPPSLVSRLGPGYP